MQYPLKCNSCKHTKVLDISLKMYEEGQPFKCNCGGEYQRYYPSDKLVSIRTDSSPNR